MMITFNDQRTQMDDLLDKMAAEIQLDKTRQSRMEGHYLAVKDWIESDDTFFKQFLFDIYPHGSVRSGTTTKPLNKVEFDLDIALHLNTNWAHYTPEFIYRQLIRRINEHGTYTGMMELKNRCVRLNYAGDFHMDILPGVQEFSWDPDRLKVPDKQRGTWVASNPRGYSKWFLKQANLVQESLLVKALRAEMLPVDDFESKKPLQRAVQLIKRFRDIYFYKESSYKTSSIILTTLAGRYYSGQDSIFDTIDLIVSAILVDADRSAGRIKVLNPVNEAEDFTDKWEQEPQYYIAFNQFSQYLYKEWQKLKMKYGVIAESQILKGLFGDELFLKAQTAQTNMLDELRSKSRLGASRSTGILGVISSGAATVKPNTFFGS